MNPGPWSPEYSDTDNTSQCHPPEFNRIKKAEHFLEDNLRVPEVGKSRQELVEHQLSLQWVFQRGGVARWTEVALPGGRGGGIPR